MRIVRALDSRWGPYSKRESGSGNGDYANGQLRVLALRDRAARSVHADGKTGRELAVGASASDGTGVSGSLSVLGRLFPSRLFGYTFWAMQKGVLLGTRNADDLVKEKDPNWECASQNSWC